jgi:Tfp pilus assembly pilus retraction ATPase PilT
MREGKTEQLENVIQGGALQGMQALDTVLRRYLDEKLITRNEAYRVAKNKAAFEQYREPADFSAEASLTKSQFTN